MKRFKFRLQRVLDIKHTIEEVKRRDFLATQNERDKAKNKLHEIVLTRNRYTDDLYAREKKEINLREINLFYRYFMVLESQIKRQHELIRLANGEMEKRRLILIEAVKERRILERLKEKKYSGYMTASLMEEQNLLDDMAGGKIFQQKNNPMNMSLQVAL